MRFRYLIFTLLCSFSPFSAAMATPLISITPVSCSYETFDTVPNCLSAMNTVSNQTSPVQYQIDLEAITNYANPCQFANTKTRINVKSDNPNNPNDPTDKVMLHITDTMGTPYQFNLKTADKLNDSFVLIPGRNYDLVFYSEVGCTGSLSLSFSPTP